MSDPIRTTHTGSLPRTSELVEAVQAVERGEIVPDLDRQIAAMIAANVRNQREARIDIIGDGEASKIGYATYITERLTGFGGEGEPGAKAADLADHPDFHPAVAGSVRRPACIGPVEVHDPDAVHRDIANLKAAAPDGQDLFMTAASPGVITHWLTNRHYATNEEYLGALADAMQYEYEAIANSGIILQVDCPDLAMSRHIAFADMSLKDFRHRAAVHVEALNYALRNIAPERLRMHLCWGNYEGPHTRDVPLADILDIVLRASPAGLVLEAANPRHAHEHAVFDAVPLPDGKYLVPGVIDSTTNYVEHPELVAQRIETYARRVGPERVVGGTDCGFGTFAVRHAVAPSIVWAKMRSLSEGAALASKRLAGPQS
jgi:5-methyltetrahydropteroyltriglutamate--homocysteine methyltransferase